VKKLLIYTILLSFIAVVLLAAVFAALHSGHDCIENPCKICSMFKQVKQLIKAVVIAVIAGICIIVTVMKFNLLPANLVSIKVRMNN